jgi:hypothetical protein
MIAGAILVGHNQGYLTVFHSSFNGHCKVTAKSPIRHYAKFDFTHISIVTLAERQTLKSGDGYEEVEALHGNWLADSNGSGHFSTDQDSLDARTTTSHN